MGHIINTFRSQSTLVEKTDCDLETLDISQYNQLESLPVPRLKRRLLTQNPRWTIWEGFREALTGPNLHYKSDPRRNNSREGELDLELQYCLAPQGFSKILLWLKIGQSPFFHLQRKVFHSFSSHLLIEKKTLIWQGYKMWGHNQGGISATLSRASPQRRWCPKSEQLTSHTAIKPELLTTPRICCHIPEYCEALGEVFNFCIALLIQLTLNREANLGSGMGRGLRTLEGEHLTG